MKITPLRGRKVCERLQRKGTMWKGDTMRIRYMFGPPNNPNIAEDIQAVFVGTTASTKLHKHAVKRNRMRRRCREALRTTLQNAEKIPTVQLLISPRSSSLECDFTLIQKDIDAFLELVRSQ